MEGCVTSERLDALEKLRELTAGIDVAMLTTIGERGRIHSRPMMTQAITDEAQLWFFTRAESGKTHEVESHPEVNVAYADAGEQRYVSIAGRGRLVRDAARARGLWNPAYRAWFPEGLDDPDLALLAVEIDSVEYWDSRSSTMVHLAGFLKAVITGERYTPGNHGRLDPSSPPSDRR
jgi:general stress protein 26